MTVVVAFVSRKGGVGKSTLARALATVGARRGLNTALADLDPVQRTATRWQRLREKHQVFRVDGQKSRVEFWRLTRFAVKLRHLNY